MIRGPAPGTLHLGWRYKAKDDNEKRIRQTRKDKRGESNKGASLQCLDLSDVCGDRYLHRHRFGCCCPCGGNRTEHIVELPRRFVYPSSNAFLMASRDRFVDVRSLTGTRKSIFAPERIIAGFKGTLNPVRRASRRVEFARIGPRMPESRARPRRLISHA